MKIVFVILHYNEIKETIECINSIELFLKKEYKIILVDNNSPNGSGKILKEKYKNHLNIDLVINNENLGFSKGNNIGCKLALNYDPDFICVINNDTKLLTENFLEKIQEEYQKTKFDVLGPKIWNTAKNINQNYHKVIYNKIGAQKRFKDAKIQYWFSSRNIYILYYIFNKIKQKLVKEDKDYENGLHGAALIFSNKYLKKYEEVFMEKTFLYGEESFLNYRKNKDNLIFTYSDKIIIEHNESISTKRQFNNWNKKIKFQSYYLMVAAEELLKLYEEIE